VVEWFVASDRQTHPYGPAGNFRKYQKGKLTVFLNRRILLARNTKGAAWNSKNTTKTRLNAVSMRSIRSR